MNIKQKLGIGLFLTLAIASAGILLIPRDTLAATPGEGTQQVGFKFTDRSLIQANLGGTTVDFVDTDPFDDELEYLANVNDCSANVTLPKAFEVGNLGRFPQTVPSSSIHLQRLNDKGTSPRCIPIKAANGISEADNGARTYFNWVDAGAIASANGQDVFEKRKDKTGEFWKVGEEVCIDRIYVSGNKAVYFELDVEDGIDPGKFKERGKDFSGCKVFAVNYWGIKSSWGSEGELNDNMVRLAGISVNIGAIDNASKPAGSGGVSTRDGQLPNSGNSCSGAIAGFPLAWLACPVLETADALATSLMRLFESQLPFSISEGSGKDGANFKAGQDGLDKVKAAWTIIKNLASAAVIIIMLMMVISQAVNWGVQIEAYTVRKMLPRLVAAIVLMQLSWALVVWVINLFNDIGKGLGDLLYAPFGGAGELDFGHLLANSGIGTGEAIFMNWLVFFAGAGLLLAGLASVFFFVVVAALSLLTGLIALVFRKILIIILLILSPLALAVWILPGQTMQNYWKLWKDNLIRALFMYPLIVAIIAAGRIFAYVVGSQDNTSFINFWFVMIGYFVPLFILPKTYKWGGSLMLAAGATMGGLQDRLSSRTLEKPVREMAQRAQNNIFDKKFKGLAPGEEINNAKPWGRFKAASKRQLWRTVAGRPIPTRRQQFEKKREAAEYKKDTLDRWLVDIHDDFKEAQGRGMDVPDAKTFIRDKYANSNDPYARRAFHNWAYANRSFQEMGNWKYRRGGKWNPASRNWDMPEGGWKDDIGKSSDFVDAMHADQQMYRDYGTLLPALQPFHTRSAAVDPELFYQGRKGADGKALRRDGKIVDTKAWETANLKSDDVRMRRMLDNLQNTGDIVNIRPEQFAEMADIKTRLEERHLTAETPGKLEAMLKDEATDLYSRGRIRGLMGGKNSAHGYIDSMIAPGFLEGILGITPQSREVVERDLRLAMEAAAARAAPAAGDDSSPPPGGNPRPRHGGPGSFTSRPDAGDSFYTPAAPVPAPPPAPTPTPTPRPTPAAPPAGWTPPPSGVGRGGLVYNPQSGGPATAASRSGSSSTDTAALRDAAESLRDAGYALRRGAIAQEQAAKNLGRSMPTSRFNAEGSSHLRTGETGSTGDLHEDAPPAGMKWQTLPDGRRIAVPRNS